MKVINIEKTKNTPEILLDYENSLLTIKGESSPENSLLFYKPVFDWLKTITEEKDQINIKFDLDYFNTSSSKSLIDILDIANQFYLKGNKVNFIWFYKEYDEDMLETAKEFSTNLNFEFTIEKI